MVGFAKAFPVSAREGVEKFWNTLYVSYLLIFGPYLVICYQISLNIALYNQIWPTYHHIWTKYHQIWSKYHKIWPEISLNMAQISPNMAQKSIIMGRITLQILHLVILSTSVWGRISQIMVQNISKNGPNIAKYNTYHQVWSKYCPNIINFCPSITKYGQNITKFVANITKYDPIIKYGQNITKYGQTITKYGLKIIKCALYQ